MKQYIDKTTVVAEIKSRIKESEKLADVAADNNLHNTLEANELLIRQYTSLLNFLDTLEVKEACDIWHDVSEKPELERPLLIIMNGTHKDFRKHYIIGCYGKRGNDIPIWVIDGCYSDSFISKWCYISDILKQTLEVKEMDLKKEMEKWIKNNQDTAGFYNNVEFAKHFFELGLKSQKEEE